MSNVNSMNETHLPRGLWIGGAITLCVITSVLCMGSGLAIGLHWNRGKEMPGGAKQAAEKKVDQKANAIVPGQVTRENFERFGMVNEKGVREDYRLQDAEFWLGPAKEESRSGNDGEVIQVSWRNKDGSCVVHATFKFDVLVRKSIIGD